MKKMICLLVVLLLCVNLVTPVFATESEFVPSIVYKPDPEIVPPPDAPIEDPIGIIYREDGSIEDYAGHGCLRITPIAHVWDEEIFVPKVIEDLLLFVYNSLNDGSMTIPYEKHEANLNPDNMVIRDLFDARWLCEEHRKMLEEEGTTFELTFDLGVVADAQIYVMTYDEKTEEWSPIEKVVNNGDGTVTCTFEHLCAIEFSMPITPDTPAPVEDAKEPVDMFPWYIILILAVIAFVVIVIVKKSKKEKEAK